MNDGDLFILIVSILAAAIRSGTPVLFATVGEIFTEKSGVLNLGLEGMILTGAVSGYAVNHYTGSLFFGVLAGVLAGGLISLIHAFSYGNPESKPGSERYSSYHIWYGPERTFW